MLLDPPGSRVGAKMSWLEVYHDEIHYTYRLALKRAVQANGRTDAHDGRFPWACRLDRASLDMPVMRVACFVL